MSAPSDSERALVVRMNEVADVWADGANKALASIASRGVSDQERQQLVEIRRVIDWLTEDPQFINRDRTLAQRTDRLRELSAELELKIAAARPH